MCLINCSGGCFECSPEDHDISENPYVNMAWRELWKVLQNLRNKGITEDTEALRDAILYLGSNVCDEKGDH